MRKFPTLTAERQVVMASVVHTQRGTRANRRVCGADTRAPPRCDSESCKHCHYDVSNLSQCALLELLACLAPELEMTRYVFTQVKEVTSSLPFFYGGERMLPPTRQNSSASTRRRAASNWQRVICSLVSPPRMEIHCPPPILPPRE